MPTFVVDALRGYLDCGILERGFCRLACETCREEQVVAFSCKDRGFCPSCMGRRMSDTAAHLVDRVLPDVPVRQWVLSLPPAVRILCAFKPEALSLTVRVFIRTLFAFHRRRARRAGLPDRGGRCGAVTVIQRYGSACELNLHLHSIVLDGVYVDEPSGRPGFRPLPPPTAKELIGLTRGVARRVQRALRRQGLMSERVLEDAAADQPELAGLVAESLSFPRNRVVDQARARPASDAAWLGAFDGFNLHAGVALTALDREGRERLCRYLLRPPISDERLTLRDDGRVELALKTAWRDGTVALILTPEQLVARLAALIPRPEKNLVRYHGVFAPNAEARAEIVPAAPEAANFAEEMFPKLHDKGEAIPVKVTSTSAGWHQAA